MSHIAVLLDNYSIECSCGYYSPNIQTWGNHRATQAWDEGARAGLDAGLKVGETLLKTADINSVPEMPTNPHRPDKIVTEDTANE